MVHLRDGGRVGVLYHSGTAVMILIALIGILLAAGVLAWLSARWSTDLPRCAYLVRWRLKQVERMVRRSELQLDPRVRHPLSSCGRRTQPPDAVAHVLPRHHGRAGLLDGNPRASRLFPL